MSWRRCVFCCESESSLFGLPNEYTTKNQWLSYIYNTETVQNRKVQCKYSSGCSAFYGGLFPDPGRVAYNVNGCEHYKWGNSNIARTVWCFCFLIFKEFATYYSNASFQQYRVVLVWRFYDHKCRHGVMFTRHGATCKKTV